MENAWYCNTCGEKLANTKEDIKKSNMSTEGCPNCGRKAATKINIDIAKEYSLKKREQWEKINKEAAEEAAKIKAQIDKEASEEAKELAKKQRNWEKLVNKDKLDNPHLNIISEHVLNQNIQLSITNDHFSNQNNLLSVTNDHLWWLALLAKISLIMLILSLLSFLA